MKTVPAKTESNCSVAGHCYPLQLDVVGGEARPETLFLFTFRQVFC